MNLGNRIDELAWGMKSHVVFLWGVAWGEDVTVGVTAYRMYDKPFSGWLAGWMDGFK
ncbi:hypothetical protein Hanom_Chr06g00530161 [Helianthus anomalus]